MDTPTIQKVIAILRKKVKEYQAPIVTLVAQTHHDPFRVLIATILSLRTKDLVTAGAAGRLFAIAHTPETMLNLSPQKIQKMIYPVGFYRRKATQIVQICQRLVNDFHSKVPEDIDTLLTFPGVGRKTANLVVSEGFNRPAVCIDTHNHRILNRLGYVKTSTPHETEFQIRKILPRKYWAELNYLLVAHGQHVCAPISPKCSQCAVARYCEKVGVTRSR